MECLLKFSNHPHLLHDITCRQWPNDLVPISIYSARTRTRQLSLRQFTDSNINISVTTSIFFCIFLPVTNCKFWLLFTTGLLDGVAPDWLPRLAVQCLAAPMGGVTTAVITNPLDIVRARIQVSLLSISLFCTFSKFLSLPGCPQ